jgi:hypothetical protein
MTAQVFRGCLKPKSEILINRLLTKETPVILSVSESFLSSLSFAILRMTIGWFFMDSTTQYLSFAASKIKKQKNLLGEKLP